MLQVHAFFMVSNKTYCSAGPGLQLMSYIIYHVKKAIATQQCKERILILDERLR